jgi:translation initiation factor IF-3
MEAVLAFPQRGSSDRGGPGGVGNLKINYRIRAKQVRVIDPEGAQLGVMMLNDAIKKAEEAGLDLVEISPLSTPPVCRIMDYGKFKYDTKKQAAESRRKQTVVEIKEVKLRPKTDDHDLNFKMRHIHEFLEEGNKVRVTIMFRGREITHAEIGRDILKNVAETVKTVGQVEFSPKIEGKNMFMVLAPLKRQGQQQAAAPSTAKPAGAPAEGGAPASAAPKPASAPIRKGPAPAPEIEVKQKRPGPAPAVAAKPEGDA